MTRQGKLLAILALCLLGIGAVVAQGSDAASDAAASGANYAIVCSRALRPGVPFRVGVTVFANSASRSIQSVTLQINSTQVGAKFKRINQTTVWKPKEGEQKNAVSLDLLVNGTPNDYDALGSYKLVVKIKDTLGRSYSNSTDLTLSFFPLTTLIQTDKAVYKPGQLVKFRIVNLDETLMPVPTDMVVLIKDSRNNLVDKRVHNLTALSSWPDKAVMTGEFPLSDMPNEGDWSITVKSAHGTETKNFNVRQYVLPKFSLELTEPSFVHFNDTEFTVRAKVAYTYDKAVEGTFNATIGPFMNCMYCKEKYDQLEKFSSAAAADGSVNFTFNLVRWRQDLSSRGYKSRPVYFSGQATVQFKEKFTGEIIEAQTTFKIHTKRYELKLVTTQVPFFLPGFEVPVQISLVQPNQQPYTGQAASKVRVSITYQQRAKRRTKSVFTGPLTVSPSGTGISLMVKIPADADFHPVVIEAIIRGDEKSDLVETSTINPFIAETNDYVKASTKITDGNLQIDIAKSEGIKASHIFYATLSRGQMQDWGQYSDDSRPTFSKLDLPKYVSDVTVVAFGLDSTGEIVASVVKHELKRYGGKVSIKSNLTMDKGEPQQWARISVDSEPESFVFLTGIDASVNLLATGQDILQSTLVERYNSKILGSRYWPRSHRLTTARIIQENGLIFLSDAFYYVESAYPMYSSVARGRARTQNVEADFMVAAPMALGASADPSLKAVQVRKFFPETMVWAVVKTDSEGKAGQSFVLPDTVTSWDITAFGVSPTAQIQTMDQAFKVTTFKSFFIRPVLPYSLVRGEKFILKVLVFNYRSIDGKVSVALNFTDSDANAVAATGQATSPIASTSAKLPPAIEVSVKASSSGMAIFELTPRALPSLDLSIRATFTGQGVTETDIVVKPIIVVPEGKTVYQSRSVLLSPPTSGDTRPEQSVTIEYPVESADLVPGSEVFKYSLIGDVMGPAMQNIGNLLRLPSGCGEQNMVDFAPAVFIWEYLSNTKQENDEVKEKALRFMKVGLQRQLTYKRQDGSYSAFGERDEAGSVWLTAFVLSTYARASSYITIEPDALTGNSVKFLLSAQSTNGYFTEPEGARILDRGLQGSSTKASHGMTAFICLALLDINEASRLKPELQSTLWKDIDVKGSISKCLWFVKSAFKSKPDTFSSYDLALSVYLLRQAQAATQESQQRAVDAMQAALNSRAETSSTGEKFWTTTDPYWGRKVGSVEATAWALLGHTLAGNTEESLAILRWLSNQQSDLGGFPTSQATVVGIRALSAFAAKSGLVSGDADIELVVNGETQKYSVTQSRRLVLTQSAVFRGASGRVGSVAVKHVGGTGFAMVTLSWQYNLVDKQPLSTEWKTANGLGIRLNSSVTTPAPKDQFRLSVCARANATEGMLILRVTNPSGYAAGLLPHPVDYSGLKRVEPGPREIVLYFDYINFDGVCVTLWWTREIPVLDLSPQLISLQKYYNTEQIVSASYLAPELKAVSKCKACPECPGCQPAESWLTWFI